MATAKRKRKERTVTRAEKRSPGKRRTSKGNLLTLTELARAAGVSIPTAQTYKRKYQDRLPAVGKGRQQRYGTNAVNVFKQIREENRRSRTAGTNGKSGSGLLSLSEINRRTKISYPTLLRYVRLHANEIPSVGSGRMRRFRPTAVEVFEHLRSKSRKGRRPKSETMTGARSAQGADRALADRIRKIESMQAALAGQLDEIVRLLRQPLQVTIRPE